MNKRLLTYYIENNLWESHRIILPEHREMLVEYYRERDADAWKEFEKYRTPPDEDDDLTSIPTD